MVQGFIKAKLLAQNIALDGFYKYPDETVAPMADEEFYWFDSLASPGVAVETSRSNSSVVSAIACYINHRPQRHSWRFEVGC